MARRTLLEELGGYAEWARYIEDYELWTRAARQSRLANMSDTLLKLRRHDGSVTVSKRKEQIRMSGRVAVNFHQMLLGPKANQQLSEFLVWMEAEGIDRAVEETGVRDLSAVHRYMQVLYEACTRQLCSEGPNVQVRQHALVKLDALADRIAEREGWMERMRHKARARGMAPGQEIVPWGLQAIRRRIAQSPIR
jgi:hypothetical protein